MRLQMVDKYVNRPIGIVDEEMVQVEKFTTMVDFEMINCMIDNEIPIILVISFLKRRKDLIDSKNNEINFWV